LLKHPKKKGSNAENELANMLWDKGYAVVRGPASGGGVTKRFQPDLVAIKNGKIYVYEVKSRKNSGPIYIDSDQVLGLTEFAKRSKGVSIIAVRMKGGKWKFYTLDKLKPVGSNFRLDID